MSNLSLTPEIKEAFSTEVIEVIRNSVAKNATNEEFLLFAHKAASYGLDPFKNEIFFIKYGQTARIQFAAEAYLAKAREKEGFQPPNTQMVHENDEFKVEMDKETKSLEVVVHEIGFPRGKIVGAYSVAYRDNYRPVTVIMDIDEIEHMFKGQNKDNWLKWTADMFGKHVQQRALKKQYGLDFGEENYEQPNNSATPQESYKPNERKDITPDQTQHEQADQAQAEVVKTPEDEAMDVIHEKFEQLGITDRDEKIKYLKTNVPSAAKKNAPLSELKKAIAILDLDIERQSHSDDLPE